MLPDDYENLVESIVASSFFANNILMSITDYWDVSNQYKPLMHLWYIGVLMQAYVLVPIIYIVVLKKTSKAKVEKHFFILTAFVFSISLFLYLTPVQKTLSNNPQFANAMKFYFLPFRLFELTIGGLILFVCSKKKEKNSMASMIVSIFLLVLVVILLTARHVIINSQFMLISTVLCTTVLLGLN